MMRASEVKKWLAGIPDGHNIAVDDGGLTIVEVGTNNEETGAYLEIGGTPGSEWGDDA